MTTASLSTVLPSAPLDLGPEYRASVLRRVSEQRYDLLVIGGGINGAGIAYDAAMRGFSVLLVEKGDFASGTSSRSSKLIHGGIRYLKNLQLGLVFEALRERTLLLKLCPHIVRPMPFLYPIYKGDPDGKWSVALGMTLYDVLALYRAPARHRSFRPAEIAAEEPLLGRDRLQSCPRYYDAWMNDARLVFATVQGAVRCGAEALSHVEVRALLRDGDRVSGALLTDRLSGADAAVEARLVVNAAGPWLDRVAALERPDGPKHIMPTKGVHILVPRERLALRNAVLVRSPDDGRVLFAIPWERMTLVGTTDTFHDGSLDDVYADREDVAYLLRAVNHTFPAAQLERKDVRSTYAGLRPLIAQEGKGASDMSREHEIALSPGGVLSVGGGKYTTFRHVAEEVVDRAAELLAERFGLVRQGRTRTDRFPFEGGAVGAIPELEAQVERRLAGRGTPDLAPHLVRSFGTGALALCAEAERSRASFDPLVEELPYSMAEMRYVARYEMCGRLADLFQRRTHLQLEAPDGGLIVAERVAREVAPIVGWGGPRVEQELRLYEEDVRRTLACVRD
jgi:glycerol-3-phosphate dehydrogenase